MNKLFFGSLFILLLAPGAALSAAPPKDAPLQYDGLYRAPGPTVEEMPSWHYLRFYPDGAVIYAVSPGSPKQVAHWFNRRYHHVAYGMVANNKGVLTFTIVSNKGMVEYKGGLRGRKLHFNTFNHATGKRTSVDYVFVRVPTLNEDN